jgi:hypothetical protein
VGNVTENALVRSRGREEFPRAHFGAAIAGRQTCRGRRRIGSHSLGANL